MRLSRVLVLVVAVLAACAASAPARVVRHGMRMRPLVLVDRSGRAVGDPWERWLALARVPLPTGPITLVPVSRLCWAPGAALTGLGGGCSSGGAPWVVAASDRESLYFELGHVLDVQRLTREDRAYLARRWGVPGARWWNSGGAMDVGSEDGLTADLAQVYADCARGVDGPEGLVVGIAPTVLTGPWACGFLRGL